MSEESINTLADLIKCHLGELICENPCWRLSYSSIAGRGLFASRDIAVGDVIFRDSPLLSGLLPSKEINKNYSCCICYAKLNVTNTELVCKRGCSMPICEICASSERHIKECELFCQWMPKNPYLVNFHSLRFLTIARCFFLSVKQKKLLLSMQGNRDKYSNLEIKSAADCFERFPNEYKQLQFLYRTLHVFNTNAFESYNTVNGYRTKIRALYPLGSLMNHNCTPNTSHNFDDDGIMLVYASKPIAAGEEIFTSYTYILWSNIARKMFLKLTKQFICNCQRCRDPTENGTYLAALYCRKTDCKGIVIPKEANSESLSTDWHCLTCNTIVPYNKMSSYQKFILNTIYYRINSTNVGDMITFINNFSSKLCPNSNYVLLEAKLYVIWKMELINSKKDKLYTEQKLKHKDRYRNEVLDILQKLNAGKCTLNKFLTGII